MCISPFHFSHLVISPILAYGLTEEIIPFLPVVIYRMTAPHWKKKADNISLKD